MSLSPNSERRPLPHSSSFYPGLTPSLPPLSIPSFSLCHLTPPFLHMYYSNIGFGSRYTLFQHATGQDEHYSTTELIYWLRATICSALTRSIGLLIGHRGTEACISLSFGCSVGWDPALREGNTGR